MNVTIRPLMPEDLDATDRVFRLAFGTFLGLPEPTTFAGDTDFVGTRYKTSPQSWFGAFNDEALIGSVYATNWGSFGFFGPLTVHPEYWGNGVAQQLLAETMRLFETWKTRQLGLFTFANSQMHHTLYRKFGFETQQLTALLTLTPAASEAEYTAYSALSAEVRSECLKAARAVTESNFQGLDVSREICGMFEQKIGDTVLTYANGVLDGLAVCHVGQGSEAGSGKVYVKFGAVSSGPGAAERFETLVSAVQSFAITKGAEKIVAGVNLGRSVAHRIMLDRGAVTGMEGIAMQRPNQPGFNRPDCFMIDDWR